MGEKHKAEPASNIENRLRELRNTRGLSQTDLAAMSGITRQAICAIEANQYLPTTAVALRLAEALDCRVEDLFSLRSTGAVIHGDLITPSIGDAMPNCARVSVVRVGDRFGVRTVARLGEV